VEKNHYEILMEVMVRMMVKLLVINPVKSDQMS
jgi:hypothetical protein